MSGKAFLDREILLNYPAYRDGRLELSNPPDEGLDCADLSAWVRAYGGMVSYPSALDAAGYAREADMRAPDAPIFVTMGRIFEDGTLQVLSFHHGLMEATYEDLIAASPATDDSPEP